MTEISRWQQLKRFFNSEYRNLVAFVRSLIDDAADRDAEDIVQDVAFHLFEKGNITEPIEHLGAYIYQSLRNQVIDTFRQKKQSRSLDEPVNGDETLTLADVLVDIRNNMQQAIENNDLYQHALAVINRLPERDRAVIIATEIEGCTFAELATRWDVPIGTILSSKSRSLQKIRKTLQSLT